MTITSATIVISQPSILFTIDKENQNQQGSRMTPNNSQNDVGEPVYPLCFLYQVNERRTPYFFPQVTWANNQFRANHHVDPMAQHHTAWVEDYDTFGNGVSARPCSRNHKVNAIVPPPNGEHQRRRPGSDSDKADSLPTRTLARPRMADDPEVGLQLSLAASQLRAQIVECVSVYREFHMEFNDEVANVKRYTNESVLGEIWRKRVENNTKYQSGPQQERTKLANQNELLEECLSRLNSAAASLPSAADPNSVFLYDRRALYIDKICGTGLRLLALAKASLGSEAACRDLMVELSDLGRLLDPKNEQARSIYV